MNGTSLKTLIEEDYGSYLSQKSGKELLQIFDAIDKEGFPERYNSVNEELLKRGYDTNDLSIHGIWGKLASDLGAVFEKIGFGAVRLNLEVWEIKLDTYLYGDFEESETFTRIRAPYVTKNNFYFKIYQKHPIKFISNLLDKKSIKIGDNIIDDNFVVRSNDDRIIKRILWDSSIRKVLSLLLGEQSLLFQIQPSDNDSNYQLFFRCLGVIDDIELLMKLFSLFESTLQQLYYSGSASKESIQNN